MADAGDIGVVATTTSAGSDAAAAPEPRQQAAPADGKASADGKTSTGEQVSDGKTAKGDEAKGDEAKGGEAKGSAGKEIRRADYDDFRVGAKVYVRGRPAEIVKLDYPLVYWVFEGSDVEKHRSFAFDPAMFSVCDEDLQKSAGGVDDSDPNTRVVRGMSDDSVTLRDLTAKQTVSIKDCEDMSVWIESSQVASVHIEGCTDTNVVLRGDVLGACEFKSCSRVNVVVLGECGYFDAVESKGVKLIMTERQMRITLVTSRKAEGTCIICWDKQELSEEEVKLIAEEDELPKDEQRHYVYTRRRRGPARSKWNGAKFETKLVTQEVQEGDQKLAVAEMRRKRSGTSDDDENTAQ